MTITEEVGLKLRPCGTDHKTPLPQDAPVSLTGTRGLWVLMSVRDVIPEGGRRDRYLAILAKVAQPLGWEALGPDD